MPASQASHNTDAIDLAETNGLIQNCNLSVGDDNVALGSSGGLTRDIIITNCAFGTGHGVSIGGQTNVGLDGMLVTNCTFNGTSSAIRFKADPTQGGPVQNVTFSNLIEPLSGPRTTASFASWISHFVSRISKTRSTDGAASWSVL